MSSSPVAFRIVHGDAGGRARRGVLTTPHGRVDTPAFLPVGTQASVKGLTVDQLRAAGAPMVLANTYHLALRPGANAIAALGGLHRFMGWNGPLLTDSGGFQLVSLAHNTRVRESGATFRSHIDGRLFELSPEEAVRIQQQLGADVAMALDHVIPLPAGFEAQRDAMERTVRWADRCRAALRRDDQALFGIVQGGLDEGLRVTCARRLAEMDFPGYAIGGLSVGETPDDMYRTLDFTLPAMPVNKPRYLMGVGRPIDLLEAIDRGVDLFDCVLPTRNGRNALVFTSRGPLRLRNARHERDDRPIEDDCPCLACRHSRGYLRHLFMSGEMLGPILATIHNLTFYQRLLHAARTAIEEDRFGEWLAARRQDGSPSARPRAD